MITIGEKLRGAAIVSCLLNVGDSMAFHNGQMFSTLDADHDNRTEFSCAQEYHGAWWSYTVCVIIQTSTVYNTYSVTIRHRSLWAASGTPSVWSGARFMVTNTR